MGVKGCRLAVKLSLPPGKLVGGVDSGSEKPWEFRIGCAAIEIRKRRYKYENIDQPKIH
jgi:hypothetical protein